MLPAPTPISPLSPPPPPAPGLQASLLSICWAAPYSAAHQGLSWGPQSGIPSLAPVFPGAGVSPPTFCVGFPGK